VSRLDSAWAMFDVLPGDDDVLRKSVLAGARIICSERLEEIRVNA
jgi:hypothetical protein